MYKHCLKFYFCMYFFRECNYINPTIISYKTIKNLTSWTISHVTPKKQIRACKSLRKGRAGSRFAPSQWETALLCNDVSHWLGASLESALKGIGGERWGQVVRSSSGRFRQLWTRCSVALYSLWVCRRTGDVHVMLDVLMLIWRYHNVIIIF